jgi:branched-chain amino acid transport system substrate-binding protein
MKATARTFRYAVLACALASAGPAAAQDALKEPIRIGVSVGLTGYAATADTGWRDGVLLAAEVLNARGGVLGQPIQVTVEDNRSEPQEAVTVYKKLATTDHVMVFANGVLSAGNFAGAPIAVQEKIPMLLGSVLPKPAEQAKWAFTPITPPAFEVETRLDYLQHATDIRKIAILADPSPYAKLQASVIEDEAAKHGMTVVAREQYKQDDADLSTAIVKINEAGAGAILKIGLGGTTLTAAKNIKQLGLNLLLLTSLEDVAVFQPVADVLGKQFFFVASPPQLYDQLPDGALKTAIKAFIDPWRQKYGARDPNWAVRGWDAVMIAASAIEKAKTVDGTKVRDAIEGLHDLQGAGGTYTFSPTKHFGMTDNPLSLVQILDGQLRIVKTGT